MATITLIAPTGFNSTIHGPGGQVIIPAADGTVKVDVASNGAMIAPLLSAGFRFFRTGSDVALIQAPATADLVSIVAAALPVSATPMTIAAQPDVPRKLQVRCVQSGVVAGLVVNIVGTDGRGNAVSESVNVAGASSATFPTVNAYSVVASVTPVGTVTNVTTIGVGVGTALALPLPQTFFDFVVYKESVAATGTASHVNEAVGTVDTVAGTISPTAAPTGAKNFYFWYNYGVAD